MDRKQAQEIYDKWAKTLPATRIQQWNYLLNNRKALQKKVDDSILRLRNFLKQDALEFVVRAKTSLSNEYFEVGACIKREQAFLPESVREAASTLLGDWSTASIRAIAEADRYVH